MSHHEGSFRISMWGLIWVSEWNLSYFLKFHYFLSLEKKKQKIIFEKKILKIFRNSTYSSSSSPTLLLPTTFLAARFLLNVEHQSNQRKERQSIDSSQGLLETKENKIPSLFPVCSCPLNVHPIVPWPGWHPCCLDISSLFLLPPSPTPALTSLWVPAIH